MFSKFLVICAFLMTSTLALSQETKPAQAAPTDLSNQNFAYTMFDYIKKKFTVSYHGEFYGTRPDATSTNEDERHIQDLRIMHSPTITYRPIENWRLLVNSEFKYTDATARQTFVNRHYRSLVQLTREKILTEKANGIGLSAAITRRIIDRINAPFNRNYGNSRASVTLSKTWMEKHSSSLVVQYLNNDIAVHTRESWRHGYNLIPTITFQLTDKITWLFNDDFSVNTPWENDTANSYTIIHDMNIGYITYQWDDKNGTYFQMKYLHQDAFGQTRNSSDTFDYYIGHSYSFTPKFTVTGEIGSNAFSSSDGKSFFSEYIKYPEVALYIDWSI